MSRRVSGLSLLFLAILCLPIPTDFALRSFGLKPPGRGAASFVPTIPWRSFLHGEGTPLLEAELKRASFFVHGTGALYTELNLLAFNRLPRSPSGMSLILRGGRWLFYGYEVPVRSEKAYRLAAATAASAIKRIAKPIQDAGIRVIVNVVPDRGDVYADIAYDGGKVPPGRREFGSYLLDDLRSAGIAGISYLDALSAARARGLHVYFRDDHHWTYDGARIAAQACAQFLKLHGNPIYKVVPGTVPDGVAYGSAGSAITNLGLWRNGYTDRKLQDRELVARPRFVPIGKEKVEPKVWVLDTSFGDFNFADFLANNIGEPVTTIIGDGRGSFYAAQALIAQVLNDPSVKILPKLVIWNVAEYQLNIPEMDDVTYGPMFFRELLPKIPYKDEVGPGLQALDSHSATTIAINARFTVTTARPISHIQLFLSNASWWINSIRLVEEAREPIALLDGSARYDFVVSRPRRKFVFDVSINNIGSKLTVSDVRGE